MPSDLAKLAPWIFCIFRQVSVCMLADQLGGRRYLDGRCSMRIGCSRIRVEAWIPSTVSPRVLPCRGDAMLLFSCC